jgi:PEP-CTERM motif
MSRFLVLTLIVFAAAAVLPATPVTCPTTATLADLIAIGTCQSQDKIFSAFAYSGGGDVTANDINANLVLQIGSSQDIHGWSFIPTTGWDTGFNLSFTIAVAPGNPGAAIVASKDQMNSGFVPNGVTIADTQTGVTPSPLMLTGTATGETVFSNPYDLQTISTVSAVTIARSANLESYEQDWFEHLSSAPEPAAFFLIGSGLLGLGFLGRRRVSKG